jgi:MFS transporter, DHA2 family, multidrug resistance protein
VSAAGADMLGNAMDNAPSAALDPPPPTTGRSGVSEHDYPDKLDGALLRIAGVCGLSSIMAMLDSTVVAVAQRTFIAQFGSTQAVVSWTIAGYMLAFATVIPITGWAADRFGTKRLFMGSVLVFTLGSLLCAMAPNILLLIIFRVIQGMGGGMLLPLSFVILTRESGPKRLGRLVALGAVPFLIGPVGGPILGGWLIGAYGWKWIFLINLPIGLTTFVLAAILFPKDRPAPSETFDAVGALLLSPGVAALLAGLSAIPARHTVVDRYVLMPAIIGVTLIVAFVFHAWHRTDHPLIDLRLFKNRVVAQANLTQLIFAATFVGVSLLVPSYFQVALHQTSMQSGMHFMAMGLGFVLTMPLAGVFMDKHGPGKVVLVGFPLMAVGLVIFTVGVARHADYWPTLLAGLVIIGLGVGCTSTPLSATCVQSLAPHQVARGTTLLGVNDQVGGAMGAALMAMLLTNQFNRDDDIVAANKLAELQEGASGRGVPVDPSVIPRQNLGPDFASDAAQHFSHAYTMVFVVAVALAVLTIIPAAFLPRTSAQL